MQPRKTILLQFRNLMQAYVREWEEHSMAKALLPINWGMQVEMNRLADALGWNPPDYAALGWTRPFTHNQETALTTIFGAVGGTSAFAPLVVLLPDGTDIGDVEKMVTSVVGGVLGLLRQWMVKVENELLELETTDAAAMNGGAAEKAKHNADYTMVNWYGKEYTFSVGIQAKVVKALWQELDKSGLGRLHQTTIGQAVDSSRDNFRVDAAFRKHSAYGAMIAPLGDGMYGLLKPADVASKGEDKKKKNARMTVKTRRARLARIAPLHNKGHEYLTKHTNADTPESHRAAAGRAGALASRGSGSRAHTRSASGRPLAIQH